MDNAVFDLIKRSAAIPSMPQVAARFLEIVQDPEFDYKEVVEVLSADPGMTGELLRLANSPLFGVARRITTLNQALALLGLKRVRSLVLGRYIVDSIDKKHPPVIDTSYYWRRSLATGVLAARLADPLEPRFREEAFIAGLLADTGVVILDETLMGDYRDIARQYCPHGQDTIADMEKLAIDVTHGQVSAMILEHWHLPDVVCDAVRWHCETPPSWDTPGMRVARIIGAADRIGKYICETPQDIDAVADACQNAMVGLELDPIVLARILTEIEPQIQDFASVLRVDVIPSQVYTMIADKLREKLVPASVAAGDN